MAYSDRLRQSNPPVKFFAADGEKPDDKTLFTGVEWEIEVTKATKLDSSYRRLEESLPNNLLDVMDKYNKDRLWFYKTDGSLTNGTECVTQPFTFRYLKENLPVEDIFGELKGQIAPWDCGGHFNPGIHIHMSRKAFEPEHLFRFVKFHYDNAKFCQHVGGRVSSMGAFDRRKAGCSTDEALMQQCQDKYASSRDRFVAVNLNYHNTAELRYFRSTTKPARFRGLIEWAYALYWYTKTVAKPTPEELVDFLEQYSGDFGNALGVVKDRPDCTPENKKDYVHLAGALIEPIDLHYWER